MKLLRRILGVVLTPILYSRWSVVLIPILLLMGIPHDAVIPLWFFYTVFSVNIMGIFGLLNPITKLIQRLLKLEYTEGRDWSSKMMHSANIWSHPTLIIEGREYKRMFSVAGGNIHDEDVSIRRDAIFTYLFNH